VKAVRAFAPGTVANVGPGLDILGLALTGPGDTVSVERVSGGEITIRSSGHPDIPSDVLRNTAGIAASLVREKAGAVATGLVLEIEKGLPLSGGQGGSAASAAAAAVATNALFGSPLLPRQLLEPCLAAEEAVSGRHADNVAAALLGGMVLVRSLEPCDIVALPFPDDLLVVIVEPDERMPTEKARAALPRSVEREIAVAQAANVGALVAALFSGDRELLGRSIEDRIAEPARAPLLPGFAEAKSAALEAGALGCSLSGSGPSAFAFVAGEGLAARVAAAMASAYLWRGIAAAAKVCRVEKRGARVLEERR
jgi:homoserine kinase